MLRQTMDPSEKKRRVKAWREGERAKARAAFPLAVEQLRDLFDSVGTAVDEQGCDESLRFTMRWLTDHALDPASVVPWLQENGGWCDCEVVANAEQAAAEALGNPDGWH